MKDIRNTTHRPLRVPLPKGSTLHLGPLQVGQVGATAIDHPPLAKLIEEGSIEIVGEGRQEAGHPIKQGKGRESVGGHHPTSSVHPSGDR